MCGASPSSAARIAWSLTTLFLITCGFILMLYGGVAPFRQNFSDLRTDGVATDVDVGLFANCDSAADEIANEAGSGNAGGIGGGVINSTNIIIPQGFILYQTSPPQMDNKTYGEVSGYVRNRCERRKAPYYTLFVVSAIMSLLAGWLGSLLLIHWLRSLKYLYPILAGASLALLVLSIIRMLYAYSRLSKYIDCTDLNPSTIDILTSQLGGICYEGMTPSQQKPTINRILSQLIPFWTGVPLLFLTILGISFALSYLLKRGPHHAAHVASTSASYTAPYATAPHAETSASYTQPYGYGYGRGTTRVPESGGYRT